MLVLFVIAAVVDVSVKVEKPKKEEVLISLIPFQSQVSSAIPSPLMPPLVLVSKRERGGVNTVTDFLLIKAGFH